MTPAPTIVTLSLGAGVQSTALYVLACLARTLPTDEFRKLLQRYAPRTTADEAARWQAMLASVTNAVFADTGWEPRHVYEHLQNLVQYGRDHDLPVHIATKGNIRDDVLNPRVYALLPAWTRETQHELVPVAWRSCTTCNAGSPLTVLGDEVCEDCHNTTVVPSAWEERPRKVTAGRIKRGCTPKYKVEVIDSAVRELLGADVWMEDCRYCNTTGTRLAPWAPEAGEGTCSVCRGTGQRRRVGSVPAGRVSEQWIGFSTDEIERMTTAGFPPYERPRHPLLEMGWSRDMCEALLSDQGWQAEKSACIGCPFHDDDVWIDMKHRDPEDFEDAVAFDEQFRTAPGLNAVRFLHESRIPLREAVEKAERSRLARGMQDPLWGALKRPPRRGCSPYGCRTSAYPEEFVDDLQEAAS